MWTRSFCFFVLLKLISMILRRTFDTHYPILLVLVNHLYYLVILRRFDHKSITIRKAGLSRLRHDYVHMPRHNVMFTKVSRHWKSTANYY